MTSFPKATGKFIDKNQAIYIEVTIVSDHFSSFQRFLSSHFANRLEFLYQLQPLYGSSPALWQRHNIKPMLVPCLCRKPVAKLRMLAWSTPALSVERKGRRHGTSVAFMLRHYQSAAEMLYRYIMFVEDISCTSIRWK